MRRAPRLSACLLFLGLLAVTGSRLGRSSLVVRVWMHIRYVQEATVQLARAGGESDIGR